MRKLAWIGLALFCMSCGGSSKVAIMIEPASVFENTNVADVVFIAENQETENGILDSNNDGNPDAFVFPSTCTVTFPEGGINIEAGCGYNPQDNGTFDLGAIPTGYNYLVEVRFRDASGATLQSGLVPLFNDGKNQTLTISVNPAS